MHMYAYTRIYICADMCVRVCVCVCVLCVYALEHSELSNHVRSSSHLQAVLYVSLCSMDVYKRVCIIKTWILVI